MNAATMLPERTIKKLAAGEETVIVALGDSLTHGWRVNKGYLQFLREHLTCAYPQAIIKLINAGVPGDTARDGFLRLQSAVLAYQPACVLVQFGLNDAFDGYSPAQFAVSLERIVDGITATSEAEVVLVTSCYLGATEYGAMIETFYAGIENLAQRRSLPFAAVHRYWELQVAQGFAQTELVQADGVHPTSAGYALMASAIASLFFSQKSGRQGNGAQSPCQQGL
ncbi:MAG: hypothetical protein K9K75_00030 [Deltaproteobacteria bacterium]|nr:hypothetical protein [Deltaproteobacteria bacterium]